MEATVTMPMTGFTELADEETNDINGGVNWSQFAGGILCSVVGGGVVNRKVDKMLSTKHMVQLKPAR